jgi:hypothetical protein
MCARRVTATGNNPRNAAHLIVRLSTQALHREPPAVSLPAAYSDEEERRFSAA